MRLLFSFFLILLFGTSYGQTFTYPSIKAEGQTLTEFIPADWVIRDSATGDLNKNGVADAVVVLQHRDSVRIVNRHEDTVLTQPRILLILFKDSATNTYRLAEQNNTFILMHDNAAMDDPFQDILIEKGIIKIDFQLFYTMGSWYTTSSTYKFRYDGKAFILIGAELSTLHRATHDTEAYSYNFLTKRRSHTKGNEQKGTKKTTFQNIKPDKLQTPGTLTEPFNWEVEPGVYL